MAEKLNGEKDKLYEKLDGKIEQKGNELIDKTKENADKLLTEAEANLHKPCAPETVETIASIYFLYKSFQESPLKDKSFWANSLSQKIKEIEKDPNSIEILRCTLNSEQKIHGLHTHPDFKLMTVYAQEYLLQKEAKEALKCVIESENCPYVCNSGELFNLRSNNCAVNNNYPVCDPDLNIVKTFISHSISNLTQAEVQKVFASLVGSFKESCRIGSFFFPKGEIKEEEKKLVTSEGNSVDVPITSDVNPEKVPMPAPTTGTILSPSVSYSTNSFSHNSMTVIPPEQSKAKCSSVTPDNIKITMQNNNEPFKGTNLEFPLHCNIEFKTGLYGLESYFFLTNAKSCYEAIFLKEAGKNGKKLHPTIEEHLKNLIKNSSRIGYSEETMKELFENPEYDCSPHNQNFSEISQLHYLDLHKLQEKNNKENPTERKLYISFFDSTDRSLCTPVPEYKHGQEKYFVTLNKCHQILIEPVKKEETISGTLTSPQGLKPIQNNTPTLVPLSPSSPTKTAPNTFKIDSNPKQLQLKQ